jgi:hypothetical protein
MSSIRPPFLAAAQKMLAVISLVGSSALLPGQGYIYTFQGFPGYQQLDGSYLVLSNALGGVPVFSNLLDIKILDSYGPGAIFDVSVSPQDFNVTAFSPQGFTGSFVGLADSYTGHTTVRFVGLGEALQPGIYASDNGFFPGNPSGEVVFGDWIATPLPEPNVGDMFLCGLAIVALRRFAKCERPHNWLRAASGKQGRY